MKLVYVNGKCELSTEPYSLRASSCQHLGEQHFRESVGFLLQADRIPLPPSLSSLPPALSPLTPALHLLVILLPPR